MTIDRVAIAVDTSACRPGRMDGLMVLALRSSAIPRPTALVDCRVETDQRTPKSVPLSGRCSLDKIGNKTMSEIGNVERTHFRDA